MRNIEASLEAAGRSFEDVRACLDFPSGYGRVTRLLQTKIDPRSITAAEIDQQAVRFLSAEFGVQPLVSSLDFREIAFDDRYDRAESGGHA